MYKSSEKALLQILDNYGFQKIENCDKYNPLGQTWKLAEKIGSGYFWSYYLKDMFGIKIHDFSFFNETIIEADMPEGLNIAYYTSISGEELNPYKRLNANCVKSHLNGYKPFKAVIHKNIPVHQCTVLEFIQNLRVSQAEYLLSHTDHSIKQIAESVGYTHTSHFADLFRRTTGLLPVEYRKMAQRIDK